MIRSFRSKETAKLYHRERSNRLPNDIQRTAMRKLWQIDAAVRIDDLKIPPGNNLEKLTGSRKGQYSIRINHQWRICFHWIKGDADQVEICDYHN